MNQRQRQPAHYGSFTYGAAMIQSLIAITCLGWYLFILVVIVIGVSQIRRNNGHSATSTVPAERPAPYCPRITVIRPIKGEEPYLYECLAATFGQLYPRDRLTIYFCISDRNDPALTILERLLLDYPLHDAKVLVEEEDPCLSGRHGSVNNLGPNPKIRNMSRAYREGEGDIVWIVDCNVWIGPHVAGRMVDLLCGFPSSNSSNWAPPLKKYKFVHQLPLAIDTSSPSTHITLPSLQNLGGLLEETFLSTSHAKFYTAINTVAVAPCIVGKSNMFRRSHLNALTSGSGPATSSTASVPSAQQDQPGIDYFSSNICEDHLIGDLLWKNPVPESVLAYAETYEDPDGRNESSRGQKGRKWGNHALLPPHPTNLAIQPTASMSLLSYISRRVRWLRVRKWTVILATLVEPGTESILCSLYGAWGLTTLPYLNERDVPRTWTAFWLFWLVSMVLWAAVDWWVWGMLQRGSETAEERAPFARSAGRRRGARWVLGWIGREILAFPIWSWAFYGGLDVVWRGRKFKVGMDMRVREIDGGGGESRNGGVDAKGKVI